MFSQGFQRAFIITIIVIVIIGMIITLIPGKFL